MSTTSIGSVTLSIESPVVLKQGEDSLVSIGITGDVLPQPLPDRYEGEPLPFPERMSLYVSGEQWTGVVIHGAAIECTVHTDPNRGQHVMSGYGSLRVQSDASAEFRSTDAHIQCNARDRAVSYVGSSDCRVSVVPAGAEVVLEPTRMVLEQGSSSPISLQLAPLGGWRSEIDLSIEPAITPEHSIEPASTTMTATDAAANFTITISKTAPVNEFSFYGFEARAVVTMSADRSQFHLTREFKYDVIHDVPGAIGDKWRAAGGWLGNLGTPSGEQETLADGVGRFQEFKSGVIVWSPATGAHVFDNYYLWYTWRDNQNALGYPVSDTNRVVGQTSLYVLCERGVILHKDPSSSVTAVLTALKVRLTSLEFSPTFPVPSSWVIAGEYPCGEKGKLITQTGLFPVDGRHVVSVSAKVLLPDGSVTDERTEYALVADVSGCHKITQFTTAGLNLALLVPGGATIQVVVDKYATFEAKLNLQDFYNEVGRDVERQLAPSRVNHEPAWAQTLRLTISIAWF